MRSQGLRTRVITYTAVLGAGVLTVQLLIMCGSRVSRPMWSPTVGDQSVRQLQVVGPCCSSMSCSSWVSGTCDHLHGQQGITYTAEFNVGPRAAQLLAPHSSSMGYGSGDSSPMWGAYLAVIGTGIWTWQLSQRGLRPVCSPARQ